MKSKLNKVFFVTYNDDNTKSPIMVFDNSLTNDNMKELIYGHFKGDDCLTECYDDADLEKAAKIIVDGNDSWNSGTEEYFIEDVTEYYQ